MWGTIKKSFFKYVYRKRRTRRNIALILDEDGHLTNWDIDKAETFNAFLPLYSTPVIGSGSPAALSWRTVTAGMINS